MQTQTDDLVFSASHWFFAICVSLAITCIIMKMSALQQKSVLKSASIRRFLNQN